MKHIRIKVVFTNDTEKTLVVDRRQRSDAADVRIEDGVAHFGRTEESGRWIELLAAPLTSIFYWS